ncbi:MAG TPA: cytochrome c biogenesis heme-transporting ATPase CcmA [Burkholderiales bacterium]|nr:cytochrome c biogenesis heme-transporting ATPase CcmA [Burkholderiales bacterium]
MLRADSLACERGGRPLFARLGFALEPGSLLRVRGANGSGKTSLLRILAGLTRPAAGEVRWRGEAIGGLDDAYRREMLFIGHAAGVKDDMTVAENLDFACRLSGATAAGAEIAGALEALGIARLAPLPARFLSQGQRRRAALARLALPGAAPLWLLDEPFAALDEDGIGRVAALCGAHLAAGGLVVLTSHQEVPLAAPAAQAAELRL